MIPLALGAAIIGVIAVICIIVVLYTLAKKEDNKQPSTEESLLAEGPREISVTLTRDEDGRYFLSSYQGNVEALPHVMATLESVRGAQSSVYNEVDEISLSAIAGSQEGKGVEPRHELSGRRSDSEPPLAEPDREQRSSTPGSGPR